jgi:hypothetical protein
MNLEADSTILEDYGAGFEGTTALRDKYIKDTPGQRIQQFNTEMKQKTYKTYQEFETQHKKMYPSHTTDQIKAAYKKYSEYFEMEEAVEDKPKNMTHNQEVYYNTLKLNFDWKFDHQTSDGTIYMTRPDSKGTAYAKIPTVGSWERLNSAEIKNYMGEEAQGKTVESVYNDLSKMSDSALRGILRRMDIPDDYNIIKDGGRENIIAEILMSKFGEEEALEFLENPDNFKMSKYAVQEAVTPKEISQIKNEFDMELIPQSKWAKNYQTNVRKVKQLYGIPQGNGEYDDVYFVIYDDKNKPYGVVDIEGTSMYAKFSDAIEGLKYALNSMEEAQNFVSKGIYTLDGKKIDGARSSKLFLQALDSDGFLHNLSWKEWSESDLKDTSSDNAKKQFIDRLAKQIKMFNKKIDLNQFLNSGNINFIDTVNYIFKLDPNIKYTKASGLKEESLQEADIQRVKYDVVIAKLKDGIWDTSYDVKPRTHLEVTVNKTKKIMTIFVEESLQEAVPKIDVEELLDAAAKMRKEFPQLRKGQSIMLTLHNMNPTMYSMAAAKHDAFTVDAKIPDLINFLDPKYYAESANLDEAMDPQNTSYGYYGTVDVEKYKLIAYKEMADKVLKIVRAKKIFANFPNITSNSDQESAVVKYLDSKHGRHIADGNDSPAYIEKDFTKFLKDFAAGHYMESSDLEEAINIRDYSATSEKSQFGGYRPKVVRKDGKTMYLSAASYNTPDEAKDHAEDYLKQYARGISEPRVPIKGTYVKESETLDESNQEVFIAGESAGLDVSEISSLMSQALKKYNNPNKAKSELISIFKMIKDSKKDLSKFYGDFSSLSSAVYESKEISLDQRRQMKIVALATGSTDLDKIYEYVTSQSAQYSSIVELKESFNKYINTP